MTFNAGGTDSIEIQGVTMEHTVSWSTSLQFSMEMQTTFKARTAAAAPVTSMLNDVQRDPGRCNNLWCFYFFTKGPSGTSSQFYAGKNTRAYGPQSVAYSTFTLNGAIQIGC